METIPFPRELRSPNKEIEVTFFAAFEGVRLRDRKVISISAFFIPLCNCKSQVFSIIFSVINLMCCQGGFLPYLLYNKIYILHL